MIVVLGIVTSRSTAVCVWRLLTMVRRGTVFSHAAFRYVDVMIGAVAAASLLTFALGVVLAPGEAVAPGVVLLIGGAGVLVAGIALSCSCCGCCSPRPSPATSRRTTCRPSWTR